MSDNRPILFASTNNHKLEEILRTWPSDLPSLVSMREMDQDAILPETQATITGNAIQKAEEAYRRWKMDVFAEDSGLVVPSLDGAPGVYSARYAGDGASDMQNISLLLSNLREIQNRQAYFVTVIAYRHMNNEETVTFEGRVHGRIDTELRGNSGFGYDPVFVPDGYELSFAQMTAEQKSSISHRARALEKFVDFLKNKNPH